MRVPAALNSFFRIENGTKDPQPIAERLLALARLDQSDERIVRRSWRSAQRLGAELDILVARSTETAPSADERERIESLRRLASVLGAHLLVEEGDDVAEVARRVAKERGTTYILLGAPAAQRGLGRLRDPLPMRLLRLLPDVDVRVVSDRSGTTRADQA